MIRKHLRKQTWFTRKYLEYLIALPGKPGLPRSPLAPGCDKTYRKETVFRNKKQICFLTSTRTVSPFGPGKPGRPGEPGKPIN